jgi:uncharacterized protein (TIGR02391 family)
MAELKMPREEVEKVLGGRIRAGQDVDAKAEVAHATRGYKDWLHLFATWRNATLRALQAVYGGNDIAQEFADATETMEHPSPQTTFEVRKSAVRRGIQQLEDLIRRLELIPSESQDIAGIKSLHPDIYSRCRALYASGQYSEAVEKSFKVVRARLRTLTNFERGSEAFGKGRLYIEGSTAPHADADFQDGVKFLTMAIDSFRNEKVHTADGNISEPLRAYEYLRLSSLAMHLLARGKVK